MTHESRASIILRKLAEATISRTHQRIEKQLIEYANNHYYTTSITPPKGIDPDVLRLKISGDEKYIFIGDAKNSEHETANNTKSFERIKKYYHLFTGCLEDSFAGGSFVIGTDTEEAARGWATELNQLMKPSVRLNNPFKVVKLAHNTFLAISFQ